jgi:hypothetical protein
MYFDLQSLLTAPENLDCLEEPFIKEEIDSAIQHLPTDKSPGPDGFNGDFLKRCNRQWLLISINSVKDSMTKISICKALMVHI